MNILKPPVPSFMLFLLFAKGDERFKSNINYFFSIKTKLSIVSLTYEEFIEQIPKYKNEMDILDKKGSVDGIESFKLIAKYEIYLNSIYTLMENIAHIVRKIYKEKNLPSTFHKQRDRFIKDRDIDSKYSKLMDTLNWYEEIRKMRAEFTHFLSGLLVSYANGAPGYLNFPLSKREETPGKIKIIDIEEHANKIINNLYEYLKKFGEHFLTKIDQRKRVLIPCGYFTVGVGFKKISYDDYKKGNPGICHTYKLNCPNADSCPARANTDLKTGLQKKH